jgi:hypothetical protein
MTRRIRAGLTACTTSMAVVAACVLLHAKGEVLLRNDFIELLRNRVTIDADFLIDAVHAGPNPIGTSSDDGDLHVAGRSPQVRLPMVAELANGRLNAVTGVEQQIHQNLGKTVHLTGVWRLWMEHKSVKAMTQGHKVVPPTKNKTNPKHVFEIHPITIFEGMAVLETFAPVRNDQKPSDHYEASDAKTAFARYEQAKLTVSRAAVFTSFDGPQTPFNYTEFILEVAAPRKDVADGAFVDAKILDLQNHELVGESRRMVVVKGTRPATVIGAAPVGAHIQVLGIPRIDLDRVVRKVSAGHKDVVPGAYEMIILAVIE